VSSAKVEKILTDFCKKNQSDKTFWFWKLQFFCPSFLHHAGISMRESLDSRLRENNDRKGIYKTSKNVESKKLK